MKQKFIRKRFLMSATKRFSGFLTPVFIAALAQVSWANEKNAVQQSTVVAEPTAALVNPATASQSYRVVDFAWRDDARNRDVPSRLYWPEQAATDVKVPLVVFSHGLGGSQLGYSHLGRYWASQGIASLHVRHAGSDRGIWTANVFSLVGNMQKAASEENAVARAQDVSFGITRLFGETAYADALKRDAIAVAGHSYGANTALLVGGATINRDGQTLSWRDPRVKALVVISAPPFVGEGDMAKILENVAIPTLHVTGTNDVIRVPGYRSDYADRLAVFDAQSAGANKALTVFKGATHSIFTDRIDQAGRELNEQVKRATREISGLFLRSVLYGDAPQSMQAWAGAQTSLLEKFVPLRATP